MNRLRIEQLNEHLNGVMMQEASLPSKAFSSRNEQEPYIWIKIDRGPINGGYYRLETDKWFRQWKGSGAADGYGLMFREFKATTKGDMFHDRSANYKKYKITFKYLPSEFDDIDDDKSSNWEKSSGYLFIKAELDVSPKDVEAYVKSNMKTYIP